MMVTWLISVAGKDRPELLHKFCETFALMEGVFLDSQQIVMEGRVSAIFKVSFPKSYILFARKMFAEFEQKGLQVLSVNELNEKDTTSLETDGSVLLDLEGQYRFGIEHEIRIILECHGAHIEKLNLQYLGQLESDQNQFNIRIRAKLSGALSEPDLLQALGRLSPKLNIVLSIIKSDVELAG